MNYCTTNRKIRGAKNNRLYLCIYFYKCFYLNRPVVAGSKGGKCPLTFCQKIKNLKLCFPHKAINMYKNAKSFSMKQKATILVHFEAISDDSQCLDYKIF